MLTSSQAVVGEAGAASSSSMSRYFLPESHSSLGSDPVSVDSQGLALVAWWWCLLSYSCGLR